MRFCMAFWPLPNENFIEYNLDRDIFSLRFVVLVEHFTLFHNFTNNEMQVRHWRRAGRIRGLGPSPQKKFSMPRPLERRTAVNLLVGNGVMKLSYGQGKELYSVTKPALKDRGATRPDGCGSFIHMYRSC